MAISIGCVGDGDAGNGSAVGNGGVRAAGCVCGDWHDADDDAAAAAAAAAPDGSSRREMTRSPGRVNA